MMFVYAHSFNQQRRLLPRPSCHSSLWKYIFGCPPANVAPTDGEKSSPERSLGCIWQAALYGHVPTGIGTAYLSDQARFQAHRGGPFTAFPKGGSTTGVLPLQTLMPSKLYFELNLKRVMLLPVFLCVN